MLHILPRPDGSTVMRARGAPLYFFLWLYLTCGSASLAQMTPPQNSNNAFPEVYRRHVQQLHGSFYAFSVRAHYRIEFPVIAEHSEGILELSRDGERLSGEFNRHDDSSIVVMASRNISFRLKRKSSNDSFSVDFLGVGSDGFDTSRGELLAYAGLIAAPERPPFGTGDGTVEGPYKVSMNSAKHAVVDGRTAWLVSFTAESTVEDVRHSGTLLIDAQHGVPLKGDRSNETGTGLHEWFELIWDWSEAPPHPVTAIYEFHYGDELRIRQRFEVESFEFGTPDPAVFELSSYGLAHAVPPAVWRLPRAATVLLILAGCVLAVLAYHRIRRAQCHAAQ